MSGEERLHRSPGALWRRVGAGYVVTTRDDAEVHELLGGAAAVWDGLATARSPAGLVAELASIHGVEPEAIRGQVEDVLERLRSLGVVEEVVQGTVDHVVAEAVGIDA